MSGSLHAPSPSTEYLAGEALTKLPTSGETKEENKKGTEGKKDRLVLGMRGYYCGCFPVWLHVRSDEVGFGLVRSGLGWWKAKDSRCPLPGGALCNNGCERVGERSGPAWAWTMANRSAVVEDEPDQSVIFEGMSFAGVAVLLTCDEELKSNTRSLP